MSLLLLFRSVPVTVNGSPYYVDSKKRSFSADSRSRTFSLGRASMLGVGQSKSRTFQVNASSRTFKVEAAEREDYI